VLVLGDMGELGEQALECHKDVGRKARELGINALYAVGKLSRFAIETFGRNGYHFEDKQKLIAAIRAVLTNDVAVLVKGSRSAKMEEVVAALTETQ
jgi:UDP-N-acetylmuramoyl-tripeptide--D-alanyl-D-alanine ligase